MAIHRVSAGAVTLFFLLLTSSSLYAQRVSALFPQFASGGGWSSDIFIDNQGTAAAVVDVSFFGDKAESLEVDSTLGVGSVFSFTLSGGNTKLVRVNSTGVLKTGYVVLSSPNTASIRASEVFRFQQNGIVTSALGVAQQFPSDTNFSFPAEVDAAKRVNTALAIANVSFATTGNVAQTCVVSLVNGDGTLYGTATINLAAGEHVSQYLDQLFPGLDGFVGTVSVSALNAFGLVGLRQDQAVFATVSVDPGPIVAPFLVTSGSISEIEPNNSAAQAQTISGGTVIAGNISFAGDVDYFKIVGRQGDVVTAAVVTDPLVSGLDALLGLLNPSFTLLTLSDDIGLISDSFIQGVLPADGTYYLGVTDSQGRGGANGTYRLHVQLKTLPAQAGTAARQSMSDTGLRFAAPQAQPATAGGKPRRANAPRVAFEPEARPPSL